MIKITPPSSSIFNPPYSNSNSLKGIDCLSSHLKPRKPPPSFHSLPFTPSLPLSPLPRRSPFSFLISRAGSSPSFWVIKMRAGRLKIGGREKGRGGEEGKGEFERQCDRDGRWGSVCTFVSSMVEGLRRAIGQRLCLSSSQPISTFPVLFPFPLLSCLSTHYAV